MPKIKSGIDGWAGAFGVNKLSSLFENMLDGFAYHKMLFDSEGRPVDYVFFEVNEAFERLTGLKRERILGKPVTEVILGIAKDPLRSAVSHINETGKGQTEYSFLGKDGKYRWWSN